ncbi:MAG: sorbosone dehydrogenase family protein [Dokdonella sp.]
MSEKPALEPTACDAPIASAIKLVCVLVALVSTSCLVSACKSNAKLDPLAGTGPHPILPAPLESALPTVNTAPAKGWPVNTMPTVVAGFTVNAFADQLDHPRWLYVLPNGDVLTAETDAPPKPDDAKGIRGWVMRRIMRNAGSGAPSANRISLLRDVDGDGVAETKTTFLTGLNSPFGMVLVGDDFYVADTDALLRFAYKTGETSIDAEPVKIADLPAGTINHHWTKNVIANADGSRLYVTVGSNSNAAENGMGNEVNRADILEIDPKTGETVVFASGLRNPNGLAWQPQSGALWTAVNERDELGGDLVPDYMTRVNRNAFYGWPYSYYGAHVDNSVQPQRPDLVATAVVPDYALGAHTASLGLAFDSGSAFPARYEGGAFVGQHGSWNRRPAVGYKVILVPFANGMPSAPPEDFLTGFLDDQGNARGRPVGVAFDKRGDLLIADDVGGRVWRVSAKR